MNNGYICGSATRIWIRGNSMGLVTIYCGRVIREPKCKLCVGLRYKEMETKISENLGSGPVYLQEVGLENEKKVSDSLSYHKAWFAKFPLPDGTVAILSSAPGPRGFSGKEVSQDSVRELTESFLNATPDGKRISSTRKRSRNGAQPKEKCLTSPIGMGRQKLIEQLSDYGYIGHSLDSQVVYNFRPDQMQEVLSTMELLGARFD